MTPSRTFTFALVALLTFAPMSQGGVRIVSKITEPDHPKLPLDAKPTDCFAHDHQPELVETTVTRKLLTRELLAFDPVTGKAEVYKPATYDTTTHRKVVQQEKDLWFQTVCPQVYTERFVKSLQRALRARGFYSGALTGLLDTETNLAIKLYQRKIGIDSQVISLSVAEEFGLTSHRDFKALTRN